MSTTLLKFSAKCKIGKINNVQRWYGEDIFKNLESQLQKMIYNNAVIFIMLKNFKNHFEFILKAFFEILR